MSPRASSSAIVAALIMPVGDDADAVDAKAPLQSIDRQDQAADVGSVARPHLRAYRPAVAVDEHSQDHLIEVGPMVLGEAAPTERLAARAFEIEARGIHEYDIERGQQIAPMGEQLLLQDILHAARRKRRRAVLFGLGRFLAEPG